MKRLSLICALSAAAAILSMGGHAQVTQEKKNLEQRVEELEKQLTEARGQLAGLTEALEAEAAAIDGLTKYVKSQAESAGAMASTLDRSEAAGFTAGINFNSREILLAGWRKQLAAMQASVPTGGAKAVKKGEPAEKGKQRKNASR